MFELILSYAFDRTINKGCHFDWWSPFELSCWMGHHLHRPTIILSWVDERVHWALWLIEALSIYFLFFFLYNEIRHAQVVTISSRSIQNWRELIIMTWFYIFDELFFLIPTASRTQMVARPKCSMMTIIQESVTNSFSFGGGGGGCGLDLLRTWRVNFSFIFFSSCSFSRLWGHVGANR